MAYATVADVQARMIRTLSSDEQTVCTNLLDDAAALIDGVNAAADATVKKIVSCRMVIRALGDGSASGVPLGATQGSQSALGYSQSWTISSGGGAGELYLSKVDKQYLGRSNQIGSYSPVEALVPQPEAQA